MKKIQFTQEGLEKIKAEYQDLVHSKRQMTLDRLQKARAMGDLAENSEYTAAKEELAFVEGRIQELEQLMENAEVMVTNVKTSGIDIGSHVVVEVNGEKDTFTVVGEFEADPIEKKLSHTSPIGKALIGHNVGEEVEIEVPIGKIRYKIIDIKKS